MSTIHPIVDQVTRRIRERSADSRTAYLEQVDAMAARPPGAQSMVDCSCSLLSSRAPLLAGA